LAVLAVWAGGIARGAEPAIRVVKGADGVPVAFQVDGLPQTQLDELAAAKVDDERIARRLAVYVVDRSSKDEPPAMLGSVAVDGKLLKFTPRYPLRAGTTYRVVYRPASAGSAKGAGDMTLEVAVPESTAKPAEVTQVYPTASILPENQLKFYVQFSTPMSRGQAYERARIVDAEGKPLDQPFLEIAEELWDSTGQRLTLLIDPGRIKRGLKPIEEAGPVLEAGRKYTLVIDAAWKDATGRPMSKGHQKPFETANAVRTAVETADWKVIPPRTGGKNPLTVRFSRPMDRALLEWTLDVADARGSSIAGRVVVADEEKRWEFHPEKLWAAGGYQLVVETILEDLAGNRVGRPFELEPSQQGLKNQPRSVRIPFTVTDR
jgi:hypothetical protein